jgi:porphobilinogen deaminase
MQAETVTDTLHSRVREFEHELKRVHATGHIIKTLNIKKYDDAGVSVKGVELLVDNRVSKNQIKQIVDYIKKVYSFDTFFHARTHSIKVWYTSVK